MSWNFKLGDFVILCCAHLAGAISLKKGGRKGLVNFNNNKLNPSIYFFSGVVLMLYMSLNSFGSVWKAVKAMKGQIKNVYGVDLYAEYPKNPDVHLLWSPGKSVENTMDDLLNKIFKK